LDGTFRMSKAGDQGGRRAFVFAVGPSIPDL